MSPEAVFSACNLVVLPGWALLVLAPGWAWTRRIVGSCAITLLLCAVYLVLVLRYLPGAEGGFGSLAEVSRLFSDAHVLLAGWVHYLAFDLFVGSWEVGDARRLGIPHLLVVPCLALTFLLGPIGLLLYFVIRWSLRRGAPVVPERA